MGDAVYRRLVLLPALLTAIVANSEAITINRRCPSNMTLKHGGPWSACGFPNIFTNQRGCGRNRNVTWDYRLCDPNYMMIEADTWAVEEAIRDAEVTSPFTCLDPRDATVNFTFGFAVLDNILIPDLTSPVVCINDCGTILPVLEGRDPTEQEVDVAMETLSKAVLTNWRLGICGNDVVTTYSQKYQKALTVVGSKATALSTSKLSSINSGAVDHYFRRGELLSGVKYLVAAYKHVLLGFSPAYILLAITGGLILFVSGLLYYVFNIGREITLYDESIPTTVLKMILYAISLIWLVKAWLLLLGWMLARPKVRVAYIMAPMLFTLFGILFAWLSSPKINSGYKGYGSSY